MDTRFVHPIVTSAGDAYLPKAQIPPSNYPTVYILRLLLCCWCLHSFSYILVISPLSEFLLLKNRCAFFKTLNSLHAPPITSSLSPVNPHNPHFIVSLISRLSKHEYQLMPSVSPLLTVLARSPPRVPLSSPIAVLAVTGPLRRCLTNPLAHSHFAGSSMLFTNWHTHICAKLQPTAVVSFGLLPDLEPADGGLACCSNRFGGDFRSSDPVA